MEFLIKTDNNNLNELITAASPEETETKLYKYLDDEKITLVDKIPEKTGLFCMKEEHDIHYVYKSFYDKGYEAYILYYLQWASWSEKQAATLTEDLPEEPPALTRS